MGNWTVTGELGAGKTILSVGKMREFLLEGKRLASNIDLYLEWLMPPLSKATYTRLTDFPDYNELTALGLGGDSPKENTFGLLALDELAMFLNARAWQKDGRDEFIIFQRHLRKRRWHTLFITQDVDSIDKQARNSLIERVVKAGRTDRVRLPIIGWLLQFLGFSGMRAQKHIGYVYYGKNTGPHAKFQDKWQYTGKSLYDAYNTEQEFSPLIQTTDEKGRPIVQGYYRTWSTYAGYPTPPDKKTPYTPIQYDFEIVGSYTKLSAWHLYGRYLKWHQLHANKLRILTIMIFLILGSLMLYPSVEKLPIKPQCIKPDSYIINGSTAAILSDDIVVEGIIKNNTVTINKTCYTLE